MTNKIPELPESRELDACRGYDADDMRRYAIDAAEQARLHERERVVSIVKYWLAGVNPIPGSFEARCIEHIMDSNHPAVPEQFR